MLRQLIEVCKQCYLLPVERGQGRAAGAAEDHDMLGGILNSVNMNGTIRSMLGTMLPHLSALPVHMLRQVFF